MSINTIMMLRTAIAGYPNNNNKQHHHCHNNIDNINKLYFNTMKLVIIMIGSGYVNYLQ